MLAIQLIKAEDGVDEEENRIVALIVDASLFCLSHL
jgi:hypothetical protein